MTLLVCLLTVAAGYDAYKAGDHSKAFSIWRADAEAGDHEAQWHLALLYRDGEGVARDVGEARRWLEKSAATGCDPAENELGLFYLQGVGVTVDHARAFELFEKAARSSKAAMYNLGLMHERGLGRPANLVEAAAWYSVAARLGEAGADEARLRTLAGLTTAERELVNARVESLTRRSLIDKLWDAGQGLIIFSYIWAFAVGTWWLVRYAMGRLATSRNRAR
jgi:TPR repeat protein